MIFSFLNFAFNSRKTSATLNWCKSQILLTDLPHRKKEHAVTLINKITQNLLTHENIKINFCIFTRFVFTQTNGKLNCWRLFRMHADSLSKAISFDDHLHCCLPLPTSSLTNTRTDTDLSLQRKSYCSRPGRPYDVQLSLWRFHLSDI